MNEQVKPQNALAAFHNDEDGLEAIQVVMIVALAAIVLIFLKITIWPKVKDWVTTQVDQLVGNCPGQPLAPPPPPPAPAGEGVHLRSATPVP